MMCKFYSETYNVEYKSLMPCNLYGPNDNFDEKNSHFLPALIKKVLEAEKNNKKFITIWGTGKPKRELLYVDDLSDAVLFLLNKKIKEPYVNVGSGKDHTIKWYAEYIIKKRKSKIYIKYDKTKPDGIKRKLLDISVVRKKGWRAKTSLDKGISIAIKDFIKKNK